MEREAFRQRMQQYKQARENNPQLKYWDWKKENDLGYQLYKNNLPSNLQVETDDYDLYGAYESNMQPELNEDGTYHLGSRDPYTGRILKSKQHPTYQKAIESEISAGYFPYEKNNVTYTKTYSPIDISGYADGSSGIPGEWKRNSDGSLVMVEDENGEKVPVKSQQKYDYGNKIRSTSSPRLTEEERQQIEIRNQRRADKIRHEVNLVQGALNDVANNRPSSNVITEARKKQEESAVDKFYPYKLMGNSLLEASKLGLAGAGLINGIRALRNVPVSTIGQAAELAGMGIDMLEGINSVTNKKWAESVENLVQVGSGELGRRNYIPYDEYDAVTGQLKNPGIGKYKGLVGLGVLSNIYQIYDSVNNMTDNIQEADSYSDGGIVDEDPPQNTSERPIINFDPKGDPYNPTYGYNPGAGYVRSVFDLYDAPVIGDALSIYDATQALKNKDWLGAGLAALTVVPFIPTVSNYKKSLNKQLNRITGITPDISKLQKQSDWNDLRNRSIERLYDPEVRARAAKIKSDYNVDLQSTYDKIINQYENDYFSLPEAEIVQLQDAKAMLDLQEEAARRYKQYGIKPTQKDFRIKVDNAVTPNQEITNHEINHFNQYIHQDNPSWNKSELDKITKQFKGKLRDKNPIDPENTSYFMNWMEQNAYGINMLDRLKELNIKPTKQNILKYLKSLPDTDSIKKAALQFKNLDDYIKWLNTMPLADNGNINEIENYNFA